jgi:hypothetical protein
MISGVYAKLITLCAGLAAALLWSHSCVMLSPSRASKAQALSLGKRHLRALMRRT